MARPSWFAYDRPASYEVAVRTVEVPLRNGMHLVGDLGLPARGGSIDSGPFPCLVAHYTPYGRARYRSALEWWVRRGYAVLICDIRGSGDSPGMFPGCLSQAENEDNFDVIEWLAAQGFSSGRVGQYGQSYGGMASLRVASLRPPHLVAIAPQQAYSSYYRHTTFPGGIPAGRGRGWADGVPTYTNGTVTAEFQKMLWAVHPLLDDFWDQVDIDTKYADIDVPALCFGGWFDIFKEGMVENYQGLRDRAYLVCGPWTHGWPETMTLEPAPLGMLLAWFDHWLSGLDAPLPSSRVTSYEIPRAASRGWVELDDLPPPDAESCTWSLNPGGRLDAAPGAAAHASYGVDADDGPAALVLGPGAVLPDDPGLDQRDADARRLTFSTEPLGSDLVVVGAVSLRLRAALDAGDGYFVAKLMDVAPDGRVNEASVGYLRASHRLGHRQVVAVPRGELLDYEVTIQPTHWRFEAGHQLRISLTSGDVPALQPDAPPGTVTVALGVGGSSVTLSALRDVPAG